MSDVFADTSFFVAFLNPRGEQHLPATKHMRDRSRRFLTTAWVIVELGNYLAGTASRRLFVPVIRELQRDNRFVIVGTEDAIVEEGIRLYARRGDKKWSMTNCLSFVVKKQRGLIDALTADHHFVQAGFNAILK